MYKTSCDTRLVNGKRIDILILDLTVKVKKLVTHAFTLPRDSESYVRTILTEIM